MRVLVTGGDAFCRQNALRFSGCEWIHCARNLSGGDGAFPSAERTVVEAIDGRTEWSVHCKAWIALSTRPVAPHVMEDSHANAPL